MSGRVERAWEIRPEAGNRRWFVVRMVLVVPPSISTICYLRGHDRQHQVAKDPTALYRKSGLVETMMSEININAELRNGESIQFVFIPSSAFRSG